MTSVLRQLQAEWNSLVPAARSRSIPRVRLINDQGGLLETISYRRAKVQWLRSMLGSSTDLDALTFGVELEHIMPAGMTADRLCQLLRDAGVVCYPEEYNHRPSNSWKLVTDGSLANYSHGRELVSPPLRGEAGFDQVRRACGVLKTAGCKVTKKCGMHVHIGARTESVDFFKNVVHLYKSAETAIDSFMAPSRRGSSADFARPIRINRERMMNASTIDQVAQAIGQTPGREYVRGGDRYCKINLKAWWQHGTVEFRQHQGTVEAQKVENWVRLILRMCLTSRQGPKTAATVEELMAAVDCAQAEKDYFAARVRYFQPDAAAQRFTSYGDLAQIPQRRRV